jgi:hypothetical protein
VIVRGRYTGGAVALANLDARIRSLRAGAALCGLLRVRGEVLGRPADHARAAELAHGLGGSPTDLLCRAASAGHDHRFAEALDLVAAAEAAGAAPDVVDRERAVTLLALDRAEEALALQRRAVRANPDTANLGTLAVLLASGGAVDEGRDRLVAAVAADRGVSPFPVAQLCHQVARAAGGHPVAAECRATLRELLPMHVGAGRA